MKTANKSFGVVLKENINTGGKLWKYLFNLNLIFFEIWKFCESENDCQLKYMKNYFTI